MRTVFRSLRTAVLLVILTALCTVTAAAACVGAGTVTGDALRLREEPSTGSAILTTARLDDRVLVIEDAVDGWFKVDYMGMVGYMSADYLTFETSLTADLGWGTVDTGGGDPLNLRAGPGTEHDRLASIPAYTVVKLIGVEGDWLAVRYNGIDGYVSSEYILPAKDDTGARGDGTTATSELGARIVEIAKSLLGKRYVYGGKGPNTFDCSGFTLYVYKQVGITIPAGATQQYLHSGVKLSNRFEAQPGDLVFINDPRRNGGKPVSHVGIYIGDGKFIHASTQSYKVQIDNLFTGHYSAYFIAAKRVR